MRSAGLRGARCRAVFARSNYVEIGWNLRDMLPHLCPSEVIGAVQFMGIMASMRKVVVYMPDDLLAEVSAEARRTIVN